MEKTDVWETVYIQTTIFYISCLTSYNWNIRKALDGGNIVCGVFVDIQKIFDTVDHQLLLAKCNHYGICGVSIKWLV